MTPIAALIVGDPIDPSIISATFCDVGCRSLEVTRQREARLKFSRRKILHLATGAAALPIIARTAWAQGYPSRPVRIIVGFAAGGPNDILARLMGQWLSEQLGQPFVVENRVGAGGNIATEIVVRAPADGYALLLVGSQNAINATLYKNLNFNFVRDIAPVGGFIRGALLMAVHPSVPAKTISEFIAYAKANPNKLSYGSGGVGGITHMTPALFEMMSGVKMVHVPYRGVAPALTDLLGGRVQVLFANPAQLIPYIKLGTLRAMATTAATRLPALPDIPAVSEFVPGYEASSIFGLGAPKNTPAEIIDALNKAINAGLADPKIKARLADLDGTALAGSPADFGKLIVDETEKWGEVIRAGDIKHG